VKHASYLERLALRNELLEALDWDETAFEEVMQDCADVLSEIGDTSQARSVLERLQTELVISRGDRVAKLAITYYLY
jgi:hypothetical protein